MSSYIGRSSDGFGLLNKYRWVASGGETSIAPTLTDSNNKQLRFTDKNLVTLFLNGTKLDQTAYNLNTANTISGLTALSASDILEAHVYDTFAIATMNAVPTSGGTFTDSVNVSGTLTATAFSGDGSALTNTPVTGMPTTGGTFTNHVVFSTNSALKFGNSANFQITSNNTDGSILNYTGDLKIQQHTNDKDIILSSDSGSGGIADYIKCDGSEGEVQLYHYGTEKLATKSTGINITGEITTDGATHDGDVTFTGASYNAVWDKSDNYLRFNDNARASFGTDDDLTIRHTGSAGYILNETGTMFITNAASNGTVFIYTDGQYFGNTAYIEAVGSSGEVKLNWYGNNKLTTKSTGIDVTGNVVMKTAGSGIDFSAVSHASGMTSELLDSYEEGTFTLTMSSTTLTTTQSEAQYTKIGRTVHFYIDLAVSSGSDGTAFGASGMPFTADSDKDQQANVHTNITSGTPIIFIKGSNMNSVLNNASANLTYSDCSGKWLRITGTYQIA